MDVQHERKTAHKDVDAAVPGRPCREPAALAGIEEGQREDPGASHSGNQNRGPHDNSALRGIEDQQIRDAIAMQKRAGLKVATDGELRRRSWMLELFLGWDGIGATRSGGGPIKWRNETGASQDMTEFRIDRPIRWGPSAITRAFRFLKPQTDLVAKVACRRPASCIISWRMAENSIPTFTRTRMRSGTT